MMASWRGGRYCTIAPIIMVYALFVFLIMYVHNKYDPAPPLGTPCHHRTTVIQASKQYHKTQQPPLRVLRRCKTGLHLHNHNTYKHMYHICP